MKILHVFEIVAFMILLSAPAAIAFPNEPVGYAGVRWGTALKARTAEFQPMVPNDTQNFVRKGREYEPFENIPAKLTVYVFAASGLRDVEIAFDPTQKAAVLQYCTTQWGKPERPNIQGLQGAESYMWRGFTSSCLFFNQKDIWILRIMSEKAIARGEKTKSPQLFMKNEPADFGSLKSGQTVKSLGAKIKRVSAVPGGALYVMTKTETIWNGVPVVGVYYDFGATSGFRAGGVQVWEKDKRALYAACVKLWGQPQHQSSKDAVPNCQWNGVGAVAQLRSLPNGQQAALLIQFR